MRSYSSMKLASIYEAVKDGMGFDQLHVTAFRRKRRISAIAARSINAVDINLCTHGVNGGLKSVRDAVRQEVIRQAGSEKWYFGVRRLLSAKWQRILVKFMQV